jgi:hypothetical protein
MTLSAAGQESSEEDDWDDVRIIAPSGPSSFGKMVFGTISCADVEVSILCLSRLEPIGASTDGRAVLIASWGADGGESVTCSEAEYPAACGDAIDMLLGTPLRDGSGAGALSATGCIVLSTFFTESSG